MYPESELIQELAKAGRVNAPPEQQPWSTALPLGKSNGAAGRVQAGALPVPPSRGRAGIESRGSGPRAAPAAAAAVHRPGPAPSSLHDLTGRECAPSGGGGSDASLSRPPGRGTSSKLGLMVCDYRGRKGFAQSFQREAIIRSPGDAGWEGQPGLGEGGRAP